MYPASSSSDSFTVQQLSGLICYLVGLLGRILLDLVKFHLGEWLGARPRPLQLLGGLVYTGLYAAAGVSFWRGIWFLMKLDVGEKVVQMSVVLVASLLVLFGSRVSKSVIAAPLALCTDRHETTFANTTFYRRNPDSRWWFVADVVFTNVVVRQLIVFCWWSLWSLENRFLIRNRIGFKDSEVSWDSILLGYGATLLAFSLDRLLLSAGPLKQWLSRPLTYITTLLAFFASVNVWRGVWSLYDIWLFPTVEKELNYLVSAAAGFLLLAVALLSNTISTDQVVHDTDGPEVVTIAYWHRDDKKADSDEMVPIIE